MPARSSKCWIEKARDTLPSVICWMWSKKEVKSCLKLLQSQRMYAAISFDQCTQPALDVVSVCVKFRPSPSLTKTETEPSVRHPWCNTCPLHVSCDTVNALQALQSSVRCWPRSPSFLSASLGKAPTNTWWVFARAAYRDHNDLSVLYVVQDDLKPKFAHRRGCSIYGLRMLWDQYRHHKYVFRDCSMCNGCHDL